MADKFWKKDERKVARFFGVERTPLSGGNSRHTQSDTLHPALFIEQKRRKRHAVISLWNEIKAKAKQENKIPVVCLTEHGRPGFWILVHSGDLWKVAEIAGGLIIGRKCE